MKKWIRSAAGVVLATSLLASGISGGTASAAQKIRVLVQDQEVLLSTPAVMDHDRVLVPLRGVVQQVGGYTEWDDVLQTAKVSLGDRTVIFPINSATMGVTSGLSMTPDWKVIDVPAQIIENRTMVPLRALGEGLGLTVKWDAATSTVKIYTQDRSPTNQPSQNQGQGGTGNSTGQGTTPSTPTPTPVPIDPNTGTVVSESLPITKSLGDVSVTVTSMEVLAMETIFHVRVDNNSTEPVYLLAGMSTMTSGQGKKVKHQGDHLDPSLIDSVEPNRSQEGFIAIPGNPIGSTLVLTTNLYGTRTPLIFPISF
ncbi:copper amine oxidase N-terminal domain-containing protein [Tumebacillus sp. ITR2]|uniref:Copper amine oxidase N-terminal domain-containing protein n=1 Tax=Tumebacillus amylolyticus TaxID=2801339 RepID=A0ABS1J9Z5_9BACL|nr:copper amine oxidase N-terminal domain-containing protein [Tumebacillus amylolyticus]MBL0386854.1 copper amine oxidase N-terminal domain-containing protein [Tumebacillus amylolyticus]